MGVDRRTLAVRRLVEVLSRKYQFNQDQVESYVRGFTATRTKDALGETSVDGIEEIIRFHGEFDPREKLSSPRPKTKDGLRRVVDVPVGSSDKGVRPGRVAIPRREFSIWVHDPEVKSKSTLIGTVKARTFKESIRFLAKEDRKFSRRLDFETLTYEGRVLHDNPTDAKKDK